MSRTLFTYTVYDSPADYPGRFVVRRFRVIPNSEPLPDPEPFYIGTDLEAVRDKLERFGLFKIPRDPQDDPVIVETWI